jgi:hypothetical protein
VSAEQEALNLVLESLMTAVEDLQDRVMELEKWVDAECRAQERGE